jgi:hypothetical protein
MSAMEAVGIEGLAQVSDWPASLFDVRRSGDMDTRPKSRRAPAPRLPEGQVVGSRGQREIGSAATGSRRCASCASSGAGRLARARRTALAKKERPRRAAGPRAVQIDLIV